MRAYWREGHVNLISMHCYTQAIQIHEEKMGTKIKIMYEPELAPTAVRRPLNKSLWRDGQYYSQKKTQVQPTRQFGGSFGSS